MTKTRGFHPNTRQKALEILTDISKTPRTSAEICDRHDVTMGSWQQTYKPAVRVIAVELGLYVPRPVPSDDYKFTATDQWHGTEASPEMDNGFKFRVRDEYTRIQKSLEHVQAAKVGAVQSGDLVLAGALDDLAKMNDGALVLLRNLAEKVGVSL